MKFTRKRKYILAGSVVLLGLVCVGYLLIKRPVPADWYSRPAGPVSLVSVHWNNGLFLPPENIQKLLDKCPEDADGFLARTMVTVTRSPDLLSGSEDPVFIFFDGPVYGREYVHNKLEAGDLLSCTFIPPGTQMPFWEVIVKPVEGTNSELLVLDNNGKPTSFSIGYFGGLSLSVFQEVHLVPFSDNGKDRVIHNDARYVLVQYKMRTVKIKLNDEAITVWPPR